MLDTSLFGLFNDLKSSFFAHVDDDFVDRANYYYTPLLMLVCAIISGSQQFFGRPIECLLPPMLAVGGMESYAEQYCWVSNTYYVRVGDVVPDLPEERKELQLRYYQWVPFVLATQALMCYMPCMLWRFLSWKTGVDVRLIVQLANNLENVNAEARERNCSAIAHYLHHTFETHYCEKKSNYGSRLGRAVKQLTFGFGLAKHGSGLHLTSAYIFTKLLYFANVPIQLLIVCRFIGAYSVAYGLDYVYEMIWNSSDASRTRNFPLYTLCDIVTRTFANNQRYTLECVLPINMVNDKLFLFIWWWLVFLGIITLVNLLTWLFYVTSVSNRVRFIRKFLKLSNAEYVNERRLCLRFVFGYLKNDGIVIARLFSYNCGPVITCDVLHQVWLQFLRMSARRGDTVPSQCADTPGSTPVSTQKPSGKHRPSAPEKLREALAKRPRTRHVPDSGHNGYSVNHVVTDDPDAVVFMSPPPLPPPQ